jgi:hypothetical protein
MQYGIAQRLEASAVKKISQKFHFIEQSKSGVTNYLQHDIVQTLEVSAVKKISQKFRFH